MTYAFAEELKDVKPPLDFPADGRLLVFFSILLALAVFGSLFYYFSKKLKQKKSFEFIKSAGKIALERLELLKKKDPSRPGMDKEFYTELADIIRRYMEDRFNIRAPEMTTPEFLRLLENSLQLSDHHKSLLKDFLTSCDMVKFAKYGPSSVEAKESFALACRLVEETQEAAQEPGKES